MRIIGGEYRSRLITMPKGVDIRPTQDKVRESVFNMIGDCSGKRALDLFAGSGAFGIEAISRGASHATFIDNNFKCVNNIESNLESLRIEPFNYSVIKADALKITYRFVKENEKFDLIFLDPPYYRDMVKICLINIGACDILSPNGLVIVESFIKDGVSAGFKGLSLKKERRYGDTLISIFTRI